VIAHHAILDAIAAHDAALAGERMRSHLERVRAAVRTAESAKRTA
jgi:DNA-binding GntR family transcriptional regulator